MSIDNEYINLKQELIEIGKRIAKEGFVVGTSGNISVRFRNCVIIKASGVAFEDATEDDYILVDTFSGNILEGSKKPSSELFLHLECYIRREDINAVIHTHPVYSIAYAFQDEPLRSFTPDMVIFLGSQVPVIDYILPGSKIFARTVGELIEKYNGVLVKNHGLITVGANLKEAFYRTCLIEKSIKTLVLSRILGKHRFFTDKEIEEIMKSYKK